MYVVRRNDAADMIRADNADDAASEDAYDAAGSALTRMTR